MPFEFYDYVIAIGSTPDHVNNQAALHLSGGRKPCIFDADLQLYFSSFSVANDFSNFDIRSNLRLSKFF
jgi:hypothetical protein